VIVRLEAQGRLARTALVVELRKRRK